MSCTPSLRNRSPRRLQFLVHALQHAQAEFAVALDGHDARVRQSASRVALELDAFLEVHQVKLHLLRAAPQRQVGDDDVEQAWICRNRSCPRSARAGACLCRWPGTAAWSRRCGRSARAVRSVVSSVQTSAGWRGDLRERHFHAVGIPAVARRSGAGTRWRVPASGGASSSSCVPGLGLPGRAETGCRSARRQTLFLRSSSGTNSCGSGCRWSQWMSM